MPTLRFIVATLAAALVALGLSVGAAMAEGQHDPAKPAGETHYTPKGVCRLEER